jgi:hypothetical protein
MTNFCAFFNQVKQKWLISVHSLTKTFSISLSVPPTNIVLSESPYGAVMEKQQKMLTCETSSSNKPSSIIWKKFISKSKGWATILGGVQQLVVGEYNTKRTVSTLLVQTSRQQHHAQYLCQARYQNSELTIKQTTALIIYCKYDMCFMSTRTRPIVHLLLNCTGFFVLVEVKHSCCGIWCSPFLLCLYWNFLH